MTPIDGDLQIRLAALIEDRRVFGWDAIAEKPAIETLEEIRVAFRRLSGIVRSIDEWQSSFNQKPPVSDFEDGHRTAADAIRRRLAGRVPSDPDDGRSLVRIEERFDCEGFFGFGTGYDLGRNEPKRRAIFGEPVTAIQGYCGTCPLRDRCWFRHRGRVVFLTPVLTALFEGEMDRARAEGLSPTLGYQIYLEKVGGQVGDPYATIMAGNVEDGSRVAAGLEPLERGPFTLPFPLERTARALGDGHRVIPPESPGDGGAG